MRTHHELLLAVFALATLGSACSRTAFAQTPSPSPKAAERVQRRPYTVELKTTNIQTLANGTTITRESSEIRAVDSQHRVFTSRTRETPLRGPQQVVTSVQINDPVEGTQITWNSQKQEARVLKIPPVDQQHGCWRSDSGQTNIHYGEARPAPATGTTVTGSSLVTAMGGTSGADPNSSIGITSGGIGSGTGTSGAIPRLLAMPSHNIPKSEDLGTAIIEGVEVHGRRTTLTTPAGEVGNDQPLVSTTESWSAPSLGITLRSVRDNPQSGKSTTEVVRLDLTEPPLSTFQPPEGYKVIVEELHQVACREPGQP
jgi:hypothetical protein